MVDRFERAYKNLKKLRVNEEKMTEEQKKQYERPLNKLRKEILDDVGEVLQDFIVSGMRPAKAEEDNLSEAWKNAIRMREEIINEMKDVIAKAMKVVLAEYSMNECIKTVLPVRNKVWYQAYGQYWLQHCHPTFEDEYTFSNDIIGMEWWEGHDEWVSVKVEDGKKVTDLRRGVMIMLPPTQELLDKRYREEMERLA